MTGIDGHGNGERNQQGVIVTIVSLETQERRMVVSPGYFDAALADICDECDRLGPEWRIQSISTPRTIAADLVGRKEHGHARLPEENMLGRLGRLDLLSDAHLHEWSRSRERKL